jgi:hypothetical protein
MKVQLLEEIAQLIGKNRMQTARLYKLSNEDLVILLEGIREAIGKAKAAGMPKEDTRPANCRFRLRDEGKPYPRTGCMVCQRGLGLMEHCPKETA